MKSVCDRLRVLVLGLMIVLPAGQSVGASPEQVDLAERLLQIGLQIEHASPPAAAALGDAAEKMYDRDARLLRLDIDLRLALGQRDPAIKLLSALRQIEPADQIAQVQSLDLISARMESADAKADYLIKVVDNAAVSAEVRSHAALLLAGVQSQRGLDDLAAAAVDQSIRLNPLNPKALRVRLDQRISNGASAPLRAAALVGLLLANPVQPPVLSRLADEHVRAGAVAAAIDLYAHLFDQIKTLGYAPSSDDAINYSAMLIESGRAKDVADMVAAAVKNDPYSPRVQFLNILVAQQAGDSQAAAARVEAARAALTRNLMAFQSTFDPKAPKVDETTPPQLPDMAAAKDALKAADKPTTTQSYVSMLANLAWLDVYFLGQAPPKQVTDTIDALGGAPGVVANRIDGFAALAAGNTDGANVKLSAVANRDPLSQLGLLILRLKKGDDKAALQADALKLVSLMPDDVWPLMMRQSLPGISLDYHAPDAAAVVAESNRLPRPWIDFVHNAADDYLIDVDTLQSSIVIGEPLLARVTLQNTSGRPMLIGPGGVIDQRVAMDVTVRGLHPQDFPGVAVARLTSKIVLQPNESITAVTRIDNPQLANFLTLNPQSGLSLFVSAIANATLREGSIVPGPTGLRAQSHNVVDRQATRYAEQADRDALTAVLRSADPLTRLHGVLQTAACAAQLATSTGDKDGLGKAANMQLQKAADSDVSPTIRAIARQQIAMLQNDAGLAKAIESMLASPDFESRLIGCVMSLNRPAADRKIWLSPLANDSDPIIQKLAKALMELADAPTTPQAK